MRLTGKTALVTAAGAGIGKATALAFAREGAQVTAIDINGETLRALAAENPHIETEVLDVTDAAAVAGLCKRLPKLDVLMNAVGYVHNGSILECSENDWSKSIAINLTGMFRMIKTWLPGMIAGGGGSIINVASVVSSVRGAPNRFAYATTKAGVIGLTKSVAADFVTKGIRCNAICPGTIDTPSLTQRLQDTGDEAKARAAFIARQPMGRLGTAEEISLLALYLAGDESAFTTGAIHIIDGGWAM